MKFLPSLPAVAILAFQVTGCAIFPSNRSAPEAIPDNTPASDASVLPGDRLVLKVYNVPEMSDTFVVANDGVISLPKLGGVSTTNQTAVQLQQTLRTAYAEYLQNPSIDLRVLRRVGISGEVRTPGLYYLDLTMNLPDLVAQAGGLTEAGNQNSIVLHRGEIAVRYSRTDPTHYLSAELRSGDQVVVGTRSFYARNSWAVVTAGIPLLGLVFTQILPAIRDL